MINGTNKYRITIAVGITNNIKQFSNDDKSKFLNSEADFTADRKSSSPRYVFIAVKSVHTNHVHI